MDRELKFSMLDYFNYIDGTKNSRTMYEGEQVLDAGHIILCGITEEKTDSLKFYALCLQTSALQSPPHIIEGVFKICDKGKCSVSNATCSCKAGKSSRCKHISAVLILCTRTSLNKLEKISQTDITCVWSGQKKNTQEKYRAVPIEEMPCFKNITTEQSEVDEDVLMKIRSNFKSGLAAGGWALHKVGRKSIEAVVLHDNKELKVTNFLILDRACQSILMMELAASRLDSLADCCINMFKDKFSNTTNNIIADTKVSKQKWGFERQFRITGSKIYEIFTYKGKDWSAKAKNYFYPKGFTNKYVTHGLKYEEIARSCFEKTTGFHVVECGLVVSEFNPWLGYSPDGIIVDNDGNPEALIEIKCPYSGSTDVLCNVLKKLKYLEYNDVYCLKEKHMYYAKVQLGMAILNLRSCYFVIYCPADKGMAIIKTEFNYEFAKTLVFTVKETFFKNMLHEICIVQENNKT